VRYCLYSGLQTTGWIYDITLLDRYLLSNIALNRRLSVLTVRGVASPNECSTNTSVGVCGRLIAVMRVRTNSMIGVGLYSQILVFSNAALIVDKVRACRLNHLKSLKNSSLL
jgi:hypothetical protein